MSFFRKYFCCSQGEHRPTTSLDAVLDHPNGGKIRYSKCQDCGHALMRMPPYGGDSKQWRSITDVLGLLPMGHFEIIKKLGIAGFVPPKPWPDHPGAHRGSCSSITDANPPKTRGSAEAFRGGDLPGLDLSSPEGRERLQRMLPQGDHSCTGHGPAFDGRDVPHLPTTKGTPVAGISIGVLTAIFSKAREKQGCHSVRRTLKDHVYGAIAETIALLGTCCRLKVGCVLLTKEGRVAGMGYNGAGPGMAHCQDDHCNETCRCIRTLHAEQNALYARTGAPHTAYVTAEPCLNCTKELALAGVRRVVYLKPYTSISDAEREARQEWIDHYHISWEALDGPDSSC